MKSEYIKHNHKERLVPNISLCLKCHLGLTGAFGKKASQSNNEWLPESPLSGTGMLVISTLLLSDG